MPENSLSVARKSPTSRRLTESRALVRARWLKRSDRRRLAPCCGPRTDGEAIFGMKIFGEGKLSGEREACMQFAQENGLLDAMTIGFHTPEQIDDAL